MILPHKTSQLSAQAWQASGCQPGQENSFHVLLKSVLYQSNENKCDTAVTGVHTHLTALLCT